MILTPDQNEEIDRLVDKLKEFKSERRSCLEENEHEPNMTDEDKSSSQFERLKASGQLVLEKRNERERGNLIWLPRTVTEYKELADTIILQIDRGTSEITRLREYAKIAFDNAVCLVQWSRRPHNQREFSGPVMIEDGFPLIYVARHGWIHHCILLWAALATLDEEYPWHLWCEADTPLGPYADFDWPQNPRSTAFNEAGLSALQAMVSFTNLVHDCSFKTFTYVAGEYKDLSFDKAVVEPEVCEQVQRWREALAESLSKAVPERDWSDGAVKREHQSLLCQLEAEYQEAKKRQKPADNNKRKRIKEPSKTAITAYLLRVTLGWKQQDIAEHMTNELKPKKPFQQYHISRWEKEARAWLKANNLDVFPTYMTTNILTMDPKKLELGARTDGRITGDPRREKKKIDDPDGDIYD